MRTLGRALLVLLAASALLGCEQLAQSLNPDAGDGTSSSGATPAAGSDAGSILGAGCGVEPKSGAQLCAATSQCPNVVVDTQAMPNCGFRVRGAVVDLVCACGTAVCPMGVFATCAEAKQLLSTQTEQGVCVQLAEERCFESAPTTGTTSSASSTSSSSGGNPACDQQCMKDCGGGAACASVCNCD